MSMLMNERTERQKTDLQRRKVSAAIKLERIYRSDQYLMKEEAVQQLEEEFEFADKELRQLQLRAEGRKRRDLESLRRFGAMESGRLSLPDIQITEAAEISDSDDIPRAKTNRQSKTLLKAFLNVSPLFQRKNHTVSVENLRVLYTGKSEFYDDDSDTQDDFFQQPAPSEQEAIDPDVINEINLFKKMIENYFRSKRR